MKLRIGDSMAEKLRIGDSGFHDEIYMRYKIG
jgi:hypothetical protein